MKQLSNTEAKLKKSIVYKTKSVEFLHTKSYKHIYKHVYKHVYKHREFLYTIKSRYFNCSALPCASLTWLK